jgi:serine protease inhibitor
MSDALDDDEQLVDSTRSALHVLTRRTPVAIGWRPADTVRRTAVLRRRRRWGVTTGVVIVAAIATALALTSGSGGGVAPQAGLKGGVHTGARIGSAVQLVANTSPANAADAAAVDQVVAAEQRLSLALLDKLGDGSNVSVSPASLYLALGMLQNGARGATASQISDALQASGLSTDDQNAGLAGLMADLDAAAAKDGITLDSANSLWQQGGFDVRPEFLRTLAAYYRAGVWQVDYRHDISGALDAINQWTSDNTHGKITRLFEPGSLDPASTVLVLANAIYFHATWATPFDAHGTEPGPFTTSDGKRVTANFMAGGPGLQAVTTDAYRAVQLPYSGGRFAALAVMPASGTLKSFVSSLDTDKIDAIASAVHPGLSVSLPRFTTTSTIDLNPVLASLGMDDAFSDAANFSGLSAQPTKIEKAIQRVYLQVGEHGTTAAAVTGIGMQTLSLVAGPDVVLDHPFLFLVRDTRTGAILFASEIHNPAA